MENTDNSTAGRDRVRSTDGLGHLSERELLDELLRRTNSRLDANPYWTPHKKLQNLLFDAGKIVAEWNGREPCGGRCGEPECDLDTEGRSLAISGVLEMMDDMRLNGWLVVLKCVPPNKEFFTGDSGGEYDAGEKFRAIRDGQWVCTAEWMLKELYRPSTWHAGQTAEKAVTGVWKFTKGQAA